MNEPTNKIIIIRNVNPKLHQKLKIQAAREEISMQQLIINALMEYLANKPNFNIDA